jgi:trk system potassium uptake protein
MRNIHFAHIFYVVGLSLVFESFFILGAMAISLFFSDGQVVALFLAFLTVLASGLTLVGLLYKKARIDPTRKDGFVGVAISWIAISFFGALPYIFTGTIPVWIDAFFESTSGFTTTGSSILMDIEALPPSLLFWRSETHWLGGMGIIVLMIAIFPYFGMGVNKMMLAEGSLMGVDRIKPRLIDVAKRLWGVYVLLTLAEIVLLIFADMYWFDAICHSFGTVATGGFGTKNTSIVEYSPTIQYIITIFMFLSGINFSLLYFMMHGRLSSLYRNEELRLYALIVIVFTILIAINLVHITGVDIEKGFRDSVFQVVSIITCTGFASADYERWPIFAKVLIFMTMFIGACVGSTGGGIKVARFVILLKSLNHIVQKTLSPNKVYMIRYNGHPLDEKILSSTFSFVTIYLLTFIIGTLALTINGLDVDTAGSAVITTLGGIGPGFGTVGPVENFASIPVFSKLYLCFNMIAGRLEILSFMVVLALPYYKY